MENELTTEEIKIVIQPSPREQARREREANVATLSLIIQDSRYER